MALLAGIGLLIPILFIICDSTLLDSNGNERFCFDESERVNLMYEDYPTESVENVPTYSLLTGGWDSQHVSAMVGYILLREKLGVNAAFYPTNNYSLYWDFASNYPINFHEWILNEDLDIMFEFSDVYETDAMYKMKLNGTIGTTSSGVFQAKGFYIPQYLYQAYPTSAVYAKWKESEFREYIINETNIHNILNINTSLNKPTVWHSLPTYMDAQQMEVLNEYHGLDLFFNYSMSESLNTERLIKLYNNSIPFICYSYSPMLLPERVSLQRVRFPDNPMGNNKDKCLDEGWCAIPDDPQEVLWRENAISDDWTEVTLFIMRYKLDRSKVQRIIGIGYEYSANNTNDFFQATCLWLKNNSDVWKDWIVEIKKYKCGVNGELCSNGDVSSLLVTIYGLSGIISLILVVWIIYKIVGFCREFQAYFDNNNLDKTNQLIQREKRRIFISIITDFASLSIGIIDFITDTVALTAILMNKDAYSDLFLILYFVMTVFAAFASTAHIIVTSKNIIKDIAQLKSGLLHLNEEEGDNLNVSMSSIIPVPTIKENDDDDDDENEDVHGRRLSLIKKTQKEIKKLMFKRQLLSKMVKQQSATIFVAIIEDVPFYILNMIALSGSNNSNIILLLSLSVNAISIGFKLCVTREFFANLNEKSEIKESIKNLEAMQQSRSSKNKSKFNINKVEVEH